MGVASMVIGIVSAVLGFIPFVGVIAIVPAFLGFILGVVDVSLKVRSKVPKGQGIAGIVLNCVALLVIFLWVFILAASNTSY